MSWSANIVGRAIYYQLRNLCSGRVYPLLGSQNATPPFIVYNVVSTTPDHTKDSKSVADKLRIQVDIYDKGYDSANVIASLVRDQLDFQAGTIAGVPVDSIRFDDDNDVFENEVRLYRKSQDYIVRIPNDSSPSSIQLTVTITSKTADSTSLDVIPPGYTLQLIVFDNSTANTGQLSCGTSSGGTDVFGSVAVKASGLTTIPIDKTFSLTAFTSLYFNHSQDGDTWNSMNLNIYLLLTKIK